MRRSLLLLPFAVALLGVFVACADSTEDLQAGPDGSTGLPPGPDSAVIDDASAPEAARPDASPRTCSDDGFCHTNVPGFQTLRAVWADGQGIAWAGTESGDILRWDGTAWNVHTSGLGAIVSIWGGSATDIWVASVKGLYRGTGAASASITFSKSVLPEAGAIAIASIGGGGRNDVWAVGTRTNEGVTEGRVYHFRGETSEGGAPAWTIDNFSYGAGVTFLRVWGSPKSGTWIVAKVPIDEWGGTEQRLFRRMATDTMFGPVAMPSYGDPRYPDAKPVLFYAAAGTDTSAWLVARTDVLQYGFYRGVSSDDGASFTWSVVPYTKDRYDPDYTAIASSGAEAFVVGDYGRFRAWDGKTFAQAAITVEKGPVIDPFYSVWTEGGEVWAVGKEIALHRAKK